MKILMVNKFLHPNGGSETYIFRLGEQLTSMGHQVQYFGMEHEGRCVGNALNVYTSDMDFHGGSALSKLAYPIRTIYNAQARRKLRLVLEDFSPDVVHLNNFTYQLTPSVILETVKWRRERGRKCPIVFTAHDSNLVCPNHMLHNPGRHENCQRCLGGHFIHCVKGRCIHGSYAKSAVGALEAVIWNRSGVYENIDAVICCSEFLKAKMDSNPLFARKTTVLHNFADCVLEENVPKKDYVLYFGRLSAEKGVGTLLRACEQLPDIPFVFAGSGPLEDEVSRVPNIRYVGFQRGEALQRLIGEARFSVCPSELYENCPFSVIESQMCRTPVLGADLGGIPELIRPGVTGELFESGNAQQLGQKIRKLWSDRELTDRYSGSCRDAGFDSVEQYCEKLMRIYTGQAG